MYQPPPQKSVGASPASRRKRPSRRTRSAAPSSVGRAWATPPKCVWWPSGPRAAASRARRTKRPALSPASASGGRISAAMRKPPGARSCRREKRRQTPSSSGRSTWQETTAYRSVSTMCGICGLVAPASAPDPSLVRAMCDAIAHRGPDEGGVDLYGRCALGHRRLAVVDLETGSQPVESESGAVAAVLNGELYNFPELRRQLAGGGHTVRGTGDTPVVPHLYEEDGPAFVSRLHGMFALALWDAARERLVLARDRVGKKPLLWTRLADGTIAFASELKALLRLPEVAARSPDVEALDAYLALQYVPGPRTALAGVHKLPPGHLLVAEGGAVRVERYFRLEPAEASRSEAEWLDRVRAEVGAAVRRRLVADVPLGALLSGGIDSTIVVALMAEAAGGRVRTFTVGFPDDRYDERAYARAVAARFGTDHEELLVDEGVADALPRLVAAFDEPLGDEAALPTLLLSEQARRHVTVALTGDGGDEAFAGYERYAAMRIARRAAA